MSNFIKIKGQLVREDAGIVWTPVFAMHVEGASGSGSVEFSNPPQLRREEEEGGDVNGEA